jgi:diadenosine tetraphosphatase ApaH/serine/threonine PP2A family protein phosphatase
MLVAAVAAFKHIIMRLALISDIHGNFPALEAVLAATGKQGVDAVWCLGDVVGYGADPDQCTRTVSERCDVSLVGNHDLAVLGELEVASFSPAAAAAVEWTRANCAPETLEYLRGLQPADEGREVGLYHASPRDPVWEYVLYMDQAADCLRVQSERVSLIGHSHVALFFHAPEGGDDDELRGSHAESGTQLEVGSGRWLLNPGSVGQPRDGDPRAAWLELDTDAWSATWHRVEYDIDAAAAAIEEAGLPGQLARRLYVGQ